MPTLTKQEKLVYNRVATVLNFNRGQYRFGISVEDLCDGYAELGKTTLEQDSAALGCSLKLLLQKFNVRTNPDGKLNTLVLGTNENGAAGYGTQRNPPRQPQIARPPFTRTLTSIPEISVSLPQEKEKQPVPFTLNRQTFTPVYLHKSSESSSETSSLQLQNSVATGAASSLEMRVSNTSVISPSVVKSIIFDSTCKPGLQWKVALERPRTEEDEKFFNFCSEVENMVDAFPVVASDDLIIGKCYFVKYCGRYYRGTYIASCGGNLHALFDFADYEFVRPINLREIRLIPKRKEMNVPFMVLWAYTDECQVKERDRVYCKFT
uniref:Tudor domain-containing protein n=1 Tax=Panagrolaimus sp. ES5 TaxID=591445 RepID=A0AC34FFD6_9BILA